MKNQIVISLIFIVCLLVVSCGDRPENLIGEWQWQSDECFSSEGKRVLKNSNPKNRYILEFQDDKNVTVNYPERKVTLIDGSSRHCDVVLKGTYSFTLFGKIYFELKDDEDNYRVETQSNCDINLKSDSPALTSNHVSPYVNEESMGIKQINVNKLEMEIPGFTQCRGGKNKAVFIRVQAGN